MASCKGETRAYRQCLKDHRRDASTRCRPLAVTLEACRDRFRPADSGGGPVAGGEAPPGTFDGTRVIPNPKCRPHNAQVQHCLKWKGGDEGQCREVISSLRTCMDREEGVVVPPTEGDKIWSDYRGRGRGPSKRGSPS
jgi:hypothetical protein